MKLNHIQTIQDNILMGTFSSHQFDRFQEFVLDLDSSSTWEITKHVSFAESVYYLLEKCIDFYAESYDTFLELYHDEQQLIYFLVAHSDCHIYQVDDRYATVFKPTVLQAG